MLDFTFTYFQRIENRELQGAEPTALPGADAMALSIAKPEADPMMDPYPAMTPVMPAAAPVVPGRVKTRRPAGIVEL